MTFVFVNSSEFVPPRKVEDTFSGFNPALAVCNAEHFVTQAPRCIAKFQLNAKELQLYLLAPTASLAQAANVDCVRQDPEAIARALPHFSTARRLRIRCFYALDPRVAEAASQLRWLDELDVGRAKVAATALQHLGTMRGLRRFSAGCDSGMTDDDVASALGDGFRSVRDFSLRGAEFLTANFVTRLNPLLRSLDLNWSRIDDAGLATICDHFEALIELNLHGCYRLTDAGFARLADFSHSLCVLDCRNTNINTALAALGGMQRLCKLDLLACDVIQEESFAHVARIPTMTDLAVSTVTATKLEHIATMRNLQILKTREIPLDAVGPDSVGKLSRLEQLTQLTVWGNDGITDKHMEQISALRSLRVLELWNGRKLTEESVKWLCALPGLERLVLSKVAPLVAAIERIGGRGSNVNDHGYFEVPGAVLWRMRAGFAVASRRRARE